MTPVLGRFSLQVLVLARCLELLAWLTFLHRAFSLFTSLQELVLAYRTHGLLEGVPVKIPIQGEPMSLGNHEPDLQGCRATSYTRSRQNWGV